MRRKRPPYAAEFREQMIELVGAGRTPEELSREFEPSAQATRNWVAQADRDAGRRADGLTSAEHEELRRLKGENRRLRHCRLRDQEGACDLRRRQPTDGPQGQGNPRRLRQGGVAAGENQPQPFIFDAVVHFVGTGPSLELDQYLELRALDLEVRVATQPVYGLVPGGPQQPRTRMLRHPVFGPALKRRHEGVLEHVLGELEVAHRPHEGRQDPAPRLADDPLDRRPGIRA